MFYLLWRWLYDWAEVHGPRPDDYDTLKSVAEQAYRRCTDWFGTPADVQFPYEICKSSSPNRSECRYSPKTRRYTIIITDITTDPVQRQATIAHEMYHRFTLRRKGLREQLWIDEMMAYNVSRRFLREQGFEDLLRKQMRDRLKGTPKPIDMTAVRALAYDPEPDNPPYPPGVSLQVRRFAEALAKLVPWEHLCKIVEARSLEEWIAELPAHTQYPVCYLLEIPCRQDFHPDDPQHYIKFSTALFEIGKHQEACRLLRRGIEVYPHETKLHFMLGFLLCKAKEYDTALEPWLYLAGTDAHGIIAYFNLAQIYVGKGDLEAALHWLREGMAKKPDDVPMLHYYGCVLNDAGQRSEARKCWQKALTMNFGDLYSDIIQALAEYPANADLDKKVFD